jgi:predicted AlkP superfamily pyrophosphatase or phosphodiesterase
MSSPATKKTVVLDVVGLTPRLLEHMPRVRAVGHEGFQAELGTVLPAVTCSVQSTFLTGLSPAEHGIVGNGWYFRELGEILFWRQHNALVQGEKVWETARRTRPDLRSANLFWWYAMGISTDITLTPRPIYHADGRKSEDFYARPVEVHDRIQARLGKFPLFRFWGPGADIVSSRWIAEAAKMLLRDEHAPDLSLVYLPHLDYDLQRFGPGSSQAIAAAKEVDEEAGKVIDAARATGASIVVLSEYGITDVSRSVSLNRVLRREGFLEVYSQDGMEYLDPWASRAFAVADHQVAHIYVRDESDVAKVGDLLASVPGVADVLGADGLRTLGLDHARSGELLAVSEPDAWFNYYYWLDDDRAPDFARTVEIHRKPGYDPAELFLDPDDRFVKARAALALGKKMAGFRYRMNVVPLDPSCVRGSHGRLPDSPLDGPVLLCSDPAPARDRYEAREIKDLLLGLLL